MTLAVVNSFPLKIDEDSLLKRKVMAVIQELSVFQMEAFTILFFTFFLSVKIREILNFAARVKNSISSLF